MVAGGEPTEGRQPADRLPAGRALARQLRNERNHRIITTKPVTAPAGREKTTDAAEAADDFSRPSGTDEWGGPSSGGSALLHHRLPSPVPPGRSAVWYKMALRAVV